MTYFRAIHQARADFFSGERGPFDTDERDAIDTGERDSQETVRPFSTCLDVVVSVYLSKFISFLR